MLILDMHYWSLAKRPIIIITTVICIKQSRICAPVVFLSPSVTIIVALTTATLTCYKTGIYRDFQVYAGVHKHTQGHTDVNDNNGRDVLQGLPRWIRISRRNVNDQLDVTVVVD